MNSTSQTLEHISKVRYFITQICNSLKSRGKNHDLSKLSNPEKYAFDNSTNLKNLIYGTKEYKDSLKKLKKALKHHYKYNKHHPQHYSNGINGMSLIDLLEMIADWKASTERCKKGNICKSLHINIKRFNISKQLANILKNTIKEMKW